MSYSNKIFDVNGQGSTQLLSALRLASSDSRVCGYEINNTKGIKIYLSTSLLPANAIAYDTPRSLDDELSVIEHYLEQIQETVKHDQIENISPDSGFSYIRGWRVSVELTCKDDKLWWDHSITVKPVHVVHEPDWESRASS